MTIQHRRRHVRLPIELPVKFHCLEGQSDSVEGKTRNLSDSGLMLLAKEPLPPGTSVRLRLFCSDRDVPLSGQVVWSRQLPDHRAQTGIQFHPFPGDGFASRLFIREFLKQQ
jgi:c-di-GMP-binding flagellar brake protein YcgR